MRKTLLSAVALTSLVALSACGGETADEAAPADAMVEEAAPVEEATEAAEEEVVEAVPAAEPNGTVIEIQMYTRDPDDSSGLQVFKPRLITAQVGDTITFVPTDPTHQSASIDEMLPAGVTGWEGAVNQEVSYVVPAPGIYGYKCTPHYAAGMIGLIIVEGEGKTANLEAAQGVRHPGLAGREFGEIFEEAAAGGMLD